MAGGREQRGDLVGGAGVDGGAVDEEARRGGVGEDRGDGRAHGGVVRDAGYDDGGFGDGLEGGGGEDLGGGEGGGEGGGAGGGAIVDYEGVLEGVFRDDVAHHALGIVRVLRSLGGGGGCTRPMFPRPTQAICSVIVRRGWCFGKREIGSGYCNVWITVFEEEDLTMSVLYALYSIPFLASETTEAG